MLCGGCFLHAQKNVVSDDGPRATVVYKTPKPQKSALKLQVEELAGHDQVLVEKFFYHLNVNGINITEIKSDEAVVKSQENQVQEETNSNGKNVLTMREALQIINQLKMKN